MTGQGTAPRRRRAKHQRPVQVSFLGPRGTFSELAARQLFPPTTELVPAPGVHEVFAELASGRADFGVVPAENSTEGSVTFTTDALLQGTVKIQRELVLHIELSLLTRARRLEQIVQVQSHPQALAQCRAWLAKHLPHAEVVPSSSTAAAAQAAARDATLGAVGSVMAAEIHDLPVLCPRIQDKRGNATRFLVLASQDAAPTGSDKTTLAFSVPHERGALRRVLSVLEDGGVNVCRIESRPSGHRAWEYVFLMDVEGHRRDPAVARALRSLKSVVEDLRVFGSYPRAHARVATMPPPPLDEAPVKTIRASRRPR